VILWHYSPRPARRPLQVIRPRAAEFAALLGEHSAYLAHAPEVAVAEALQPVADFRVEHEVIQAPYLIGHDWSEYLRVLTLSALSGLCASRTDRASSPDSTKNIMPAAAVAEVVLQCGIMTSGGRGVSTANRIRGSLSLNPPVIEG
jgi:hypothetical protein